MSIVPSNPRGRIFMGKILHIEFATRKFKTVRRKRLGKNIHQLVQVRNIINFKLWITLDHEQKNVLCSRVKNRVLYYRNYTFIVTEHYRSVGRNI